MTDIIAPSSPRPPSRSSTSCLARIQWRLHCVLSCSTSEYVSETRVRCLGVLAPITYKTAQESRGVRRASHQVLVKFADEARMGRVGLNDVTSSYSTSFRPPHPIPAPYAKSKQYLMSRSVPVAASHEANVHGCIAFIVSHNSSGGVASVMSGYGQNLEYIRFPGVFQPRILEEALRDGEYTKRAIAY